MFLFWHQAKCVQWIKLVWECVQSVQGVQCKNWSLKIERLFIDKEPVLIWHPAKCVELTKLVWEWTSYENLKVYCLYSVQETCLSVQTQELVWQLLVNNPLHRQIKQLYQDWRWFSSDFNKYFYPTSLTKTHIGSRMWMGLITTQFSSNKSNKEKCPHRHVYEHFK